MRLRYTDETLSDYESAVLYYEMQDPGLGVRFVLEVDELTATMLEFPRMGVVVDQAESDLGIRRCIFHAFGVEVDYVLNPGELVIVAMFHTSREPGFWLKRLKR